MQGRALGIIIIIEKYDVVFVSFCFLVCLFCLWGTFAGISSTTTTNDNMNRGAAVDAYTLVNRSSIIRGARAMREVETKSIRTGTWTIHRLV